MRSLCIVLGCLAIFLSGCGSKPIVPPHRNQSDFESRYSQFQFTDLEPRADPEKVNVAIVDCIEAIGGLYVDIAVFAHQNRYPPLDKGELAGTAWSVAAMIEEHPHRWISAHDETGKSVELHSPTTSSGGYWLPLLIPPSRPEHEMRGPRVIMRRGEYDVVIQTVRLATPGNANKSHCVFVEGIERDPPSSWSSSQFHYHR